MPFANDFTLPASASGLSLPDGPASKLFLVFTTANDPATGASWCPDVRAACTSLSSLGFLSWTSNPDGIRPAR